MRIELHGDTTVQYLDEVGPAIVTRDDTSDLIGNAWIDHVELIAVPVSRLDPEFFRLRSLMAGEIIQKLVNYQVKLAVIGDISGYEEASNSFRDFVWESNRGEHAWFLPDAAALAEKLAARSAGR